jgi:hypothetical protein
MIVKLKGNKLCFVRTSWFEQQSCSSFHWFVYSNYTVSALLLTHMHTWYVGLKLRHIPKLLRIFWW